MELKIDEFFVKTECENFKGYINNELDCSSEDCILIIDRELWAISSKDGDDWSTKKFNNKGWEILFKKFKGIKSPTLNEVMNIEIICHGLIIKGIGTFKNMKKFIGEGKLEYIKI